SWPQLAGGTWRTGGEFPSTSQGNAKLKGWHLRLALSHASQGELGPYMRRADLIALAQSTGFPRLSIYLPTHLTYPEIEQDPIRLSTLLKEADQQLEAAGLRRPDIDDLLAEARGRVPASMFWRFQDHGLAVLI